MISFKWRKYARTAALAQLAAYLAWLLSFLAHVFISNWARCGLEGEQEDNARWCAVSMGCLVASGVAAAPFVLMEASLLWWYGPGNALVRRGGMHMCALLALHLAVLVVSLLGGNEMVDAELLIAVQLVLMWSRLSSFFRSSPAATQWAQYQCSFPVRLTNSSRACHPPFAIQQYPHHIQTANNGKDIFHCSK